MEPLPSPTTPSSPLSPTFSRALDPSATVRRMPPRLQVVTSLSLHQLQQSSLSQASSPSANAHPITLRHRRNASSLSSIFISPATEAMLNQPLTALPTPISARGNLYPIVNHILSPRREDGRQSRMSIRSPMATPLHSPILERILALPLRMSANSTSSGTTMTNIDSLQQSTPTAANKPEEAYTRWRPWTPVHTRAPAVSFPPSRSPSRSRSRASHRRGSSSTTRTGSIKKRVRSPATQIPRHRRPLPSIHTLSATHIPQYHRIQQRHNPPTHPARPTHQRHHRPSASRIPPVAFTVSSAYACSTRFARKMVPSSRTAHGGELDVSGLDTALYTTGCMAGSTGLF